MLLDALKRKCEMLGVPALPDALVASIPAQRLWHFRGDALRAAYRISTSRAAPSCVRDSLGTPDGLFSVVEKIGAGAPAGTVFKARVSTGKHFSEFLKDAPGENLITSRILRLQGEEDGRNRGGNVDTYSRFVYIHGTNQEEKLGSPNSHGCILLGNADDLICVRFGNALVLDSGWDLMSVDVGQAKGQNVKRVLGVDEMRAPIPGFGANLKVRVGPAFDVRSGTTYPFECLIGETPGGNFSAILLFEELDRQGKPVGKPKLFRLSPEPLADTLVDEIRKNPNWGKWNQMFDLNGGGWYFYPVKGRR